MHVNVEMKVNQIKFDWFLFHLPPSVFLNFCSLKTSLLGIQSPCNYRSAALSLSLIVLFSYECYLHLFLVSPATRTYDCCWNSNSCVICFALFPFVSPNSLFFSDSSGHFFVIVTNCQRTRSSSFSSPIFVSLDQMTKSQSDWSWFGCQTFVCSFQLMINFIGHTHFSGYCSVWILSIHLGLPTYHHHHHHHHHHHLIITLIFFFQCFNLFTLDGTNYRRVFRTNSQISPLRIRTVR